MTKAKNIVFVFGDDRAPAPEEIEAVAYFKGREIVFHNVSTHEDVVRLFAWPNPTPAEVFITESAPTKTVAYLGLIESDENDNPVIEGVYYAVNTDTDN